MGNFISMLTSASPYTAITGHRQTGASTAEAKDYDDLVVLPYQIDSSWVSSIYTEASARAWASLPFVNLGGEVINNGTPVAVLGRVEDISYLVGRLEGASGVEANNRTLQVVLEEQ
jgi:hypothetical protein